ncbi:MAG TPA: signal peptidase I [Gammaproteobacteria bacterium]|nr:signal peptidase I [Gammaproteobacteria bacterium]
MDFDFELLLTVLTLITGFIALVDVLFFARHRTGEMPKVAEYAHSFFPVLLIVLLLRSFLVEPFRIPSGSLEPTLLPGDFVAANKFAYGLKLPVLHTKILAVGEPQEGDIAIFRWPLHPNIDLIKRIVGVPGDKISYVNKVLSINGVVQPQKDLGPAVDIDEAGHNIPVEKYQETINGIKHDIYINPKIPAQDMTVVVPPNSYFAMGDNRDNSYDSRGWGFVPEQNLLGKAFVIWMSWNTQMNSVDWHRIGTLINHTAP